MTPRALLISVFVVSLAVMAPEVRAQDAVRLYAPQALVDTGLLRHILPRFSLKTQVRVTVVERAADADIALGDTGRALWQGADQLWHMNVAGEGARVTRFADWLTSEVGKNTVFSFAPDGAALFEPPGEVERVVVEVEITGDTDLGYKVSRAKCTRCHAVDEATRFAGIGSTPSFMVLRGMPDWQQRFEAFFALNPHPAFTQITDVTPPFDESRPSPIAPIEMTLEELEAMLAYVAIMEAADLGAPIKAQ